MVQVSVKEGKKRQIILYWFLRIRGVVLVGVVGEFVGGTHATPLLKFGGGSM